MHEVAATCRDVQRRRRAPRGVPQVAWPSRHRVAARVQVKHRVCEKTYHERKVSDAVIQSSCETGERDDRERGGGVLHPGQIPGLAEQMVE